MAGKNLGFFKVHVNRVVAVEASCQAPNPTGAELGRRCDPAKVGLKRCSFADRPGAAGVVICAYTPNTSVRIGSNWIVSGLAGALVELKVPLPGYRNGR